MSLLAKPRIAGVVGVAYVDQCALFDSPLFRYSLEARLVSRTRKVFPFVLAKREFYTEIEKLNRKG